MAFWKRYSPRFEASRSYFRCTLIGEVGAPDFAKGFLYAASFAKLILAFLLGLLLAVEWWRELISIYAE